MVYITNYISFILINIFFSLEKKIKVYYQRNHIIKVLSSETQSAKNYTKKQ